jgi:hypothetical protein
MIQYWSNLDTGNGGFIIVNSSVPAIASPLQGAFKNLKIANAGSTTQVTVTADQVVVQNSGGGTTLLTTYAPPVIQTVVNGANGLDAGAVASASWYAVHAIYNSNTQTAAGLLSLSATNPTLPSGYTYSARLGWVRTQTGGTSLLNILQYGRQAQYVIDAGVTTVTRDISNGVQGTYSATSPTLAAVSVANFVPTTASAIRVGGTGNWKNGAGANIAVAPSTSWGGTNNGPEGSNGNTWFLTRLTAETSIGVEFILEATTIAWCSNAAGGEICCYGWTDNL